jgi:hypothetical protein
MFWIISYFLIACVLFGVGLAILDDGDAGPLLFASVFWPLVLAAIVIFCPFVLAGFVAFAGTKRLIEKCAKTRKNSAVKKAKK